LLIVRLTISRGQRSSSVTALGVAANSAYASSTSTMPSVASCTASTTSSPVTVPVGLFGVVRKVMAGRCRRTASTAASSPIVKSAARRSATQPVLVPAASSGCIEYDGSKPSASRPGPAEGLADLLQDLVRAVGRPDLLDGQRHAGARGQVAGQVVRSASASRSG
jgi:hypothetical protein